MPASGDTINQRQSNLPLPDKPPVESDWNSSDSSTVNVGSGRVESDISASGQGGDTLRGPATAGSDVREDSSETMKHTAGSNVGRVAKDNLDGIPNDAVTRDKKDAAGLSQTTK
ncbi:hypothetical protein P152DRAFT_246278 [Eremomyces bilateralis CBS 781.70]|uniref:Uncharacterized protein n=1 Tax=Eremomyces bilateralis CBS 781.70 TaxID=1392243 RepID=A0A6G1GB08_9PEZI|nr:uncharacterized protein P152DRAFT_246278 [Eremomyces bilateralis CBS 781.70]KAF1815116.1 hypothetical protein P152DRAFT_246278 [Eremomyces bilateralis CBS 781.70]